MRTCTSSHRAGIHRAGTALAALLLAACGGEGSADGGAAPDAAEIARDPFGAARRASRSTKVEPDELANPWRLRELLPESVGAWERRGVDLEEYEEQSVHAQTEASADYHKGGGEGTQPQIVQVSIADTGSLAGLMNMLRSQRDMEMDGERIRTFERDGHFVVESVDTERSQASRIALVGDRLKVEVSTYNAPLDAVVALFDAVDLDALARMEKSGEIRKPTALQLVPMPDVEALKAWMPGTLGGTEVQQVATWSVEGPMPPEHVAARALVQGPWLCGVRVYREAADARSEHPANEEAVRGKLATRVSSRRLADATIDTAEWSGVPVIHGVAGEGNRGFGVALGLRGRIAVELFGPPDAAALEEAWATLDWAALDALLE